LYAFGMCLFVGGALAFPAPAEAEETPSTPEAAPEVEAAAAPEAEAEAAPEVEAAAAPEAEAAAAPEAEAAAAPEAEAEAAPEAEAETDDTWGLVVEVGTMSGIGWMRWAEDGSAAGFKLLSGYALDDYYNATVFESALLAVRRFPLGKTNMAFQGGIGLGFNYYDLDLLWMFESQIEVELSERAFITAGGVFSSDGYGNQYAPQVALALKL
jgi:hypothetical protein